LCSLSNEAKQDIPDFAIGKHSFQRCLYLQACGNNRGPGFSIGFAAKGWQSVTSIIFGPDLSYSVVLVGLLLAPGFRNIVIAPTLGDVMRKKYGAAAQLLTASLQSPFASDCRGYGKAGGITLQAVTGWPLAICIVVVTASTALVLSAVD